MIDGCKPPVVGVSNTFHGLGSLVKVLTSEHDPQPHIRSNTLPFEGLTLHGVLHKVEVASDEAIFEDALPVVEAMPFHVGFGHRPARLTAPIRPLPKTSKAWAESGGHLVHTTCRPHHTFEQPVIEVCRLSVSHRRPLPPAANGQA